MVLRAGPPLTSASTRRGERGRLHIGYLSGDFHDHPVAHDVVGLFKLHDRDRFQVTAFSFGPDDASANRKAIMEACDDFYEIRNLDTRAAATFIQNKDVDILVDLKGFTLPHRMEISALRPAPVQVSYLGFPGTSGADFFDYILTDRTVTPLGAEKFYSEKFVHLPVSYHITDDRQKVAAGALSRIDEGLPPDAFVLAGFNRPFKIDREMFATWMRLLKILPDAVLWLLATDPLTAANLRAAAASHGIKPERIIFAKRRKKAEHLERLALADLALDTRIYNGHTTTIDALWVGLPVITILGDHFASRASASLLEALEMPELITRSFKEYQMLIADLARDRGRLAGLRGALREKCKTQPLFNTEKSVRNIERAYLDIWQRYSDGNEPISFDLSQAKIQ